jgi:sugar phosphate isomerase/epimerase
MIAPYHVLPSTTSHKGEPLETTLEVFARLGMRDVDLNLHHIVQRGAAPETVRDLLASNGLRLGIASGGWCDFFHEDPEFRETFASVERQVSLARVLGVDRIRLFFGRLPLDAYSPRACATAAANIRELTSRHADVLFVFENHDGASSRPRACREILETVDRQNVRLNFDPINFEHAGVNSLAALDEVQHLVAHVHLKGLDAAGFCEFGAGDVDLVPVIRRLIDCGYRGGFTVEYEGPFDRTVRLYKGYRHAQAVIASLVAA